MLQSETGALTNQLGVNLQQRGQGSVHAELQRESGFGIDQCVLFWPVVCGILGVCLRNIPLSKLDTTWYPFVEL